MVQKRENWIDWVKLFACILVALGHFFQSMVASGIWHETQLQSWFEGTIYCFHVPLFFVCSGYLHQKTCQASLRGWSQNLLKKLLALGVPYFVFSFVTWGLKRVFTGAVNNQSGGLLESLFLEPISPYWYLYALFGMFVVTPAFSGKKKAIIVLTCAAVLKCVHIAFNGVGVYMIDTVCANQIWFVLGMCICTWQLQRSCHIMTFLIAGGAAAGVFLAASIVLGSYSIQSDLVSVLMGLVGCAATVLLAWGIPVKSGIVEKLGQYTMPVFLMHTIFAAGIRAVLLKLGITGPLIHVVLGLTASFAGPVLAAEVMKKLKLDFVYNPGKYIRFPKPIKEQKHV